MTMDNPTRTHVYHWHIEGTALSQMQSVLSLGSLDGGAGLRCESMRGQPGSPFTADSPQPKGEPVDCGLLNLCEPKGCQRSADAAYCEKRATRSSTTCASPGIATGKSVDSAHVRSAVATLRSYA